MPLGGLAPALPSLRERLVTAAWGLVLLLVSLAAAWIGYFVLPPAGSGWTAVGIGALVLLGFTGALAALFLLLLPALLPVR